MSSLITEKCLSCAYCGRVAQSTTTSRCCDYILIERHMRKSPSENCDKYIKRTRNNSKAFSWRKLMEDEKREYERRIEKSKEV